MAAQQSLFASTWCFRGRVGTSSARFSEDRVYRYELTRTWDPSRRPLTLLSTSTSFSYVGLVNRRGVGR